MACPCCGGLDEARALLADIDERDLSELARMALLIAQGLLDQADGLHRAKLVRMRKAHAGLAPLVHPVGVGMRRELEGYMALSLGALGQHDEAAQLWAQAIDLLRRHHHTLLIGRYAQLGR